MSARSRLFGALLVALTPALLSVGCDGPINDAGPTTTVPRSTPQPPDSVAADPDTAPPDTSPADTSSLDSTTAPTPTSPTTTQADAADADPSATVAALRRGRPKPTTPTSTSTTTSAAPSSGVLLQDTYDGPDGLITNEYAFYNPTSGTAVRSATWQMTSGSLFRQANTGWSGNPDDVEPNATSSNGTDSAIFRLTTARFDLVNVKVSLRLRVNGFTSTGSTPVTDWDGVHIFLRYQSEYELYYASVDRRDGSVVLKKKCQGGDSNGGTYYTMGATGHDSLPIGTWRDVSASVTTLADGRVQLRVWHGATLMTEAIDNGVGCATITGPGAIGLRGDNVDFNIDDLTVTSAG